VKGAGKLFSKLLNILKKFIKPALIIFGILVIIYIIFLSLLWKRYLLNFFAGTIAVIYNRGN